MDITWVKSWHESDVAIFNSVKTFSASASATNVPLEDFKGIPRSSKGETLPFCESSLGAQPTDVRNPPNNGCEVPCRQPLAPITHTHLADPLQDSNEAQDQEIKLKDHYRIDLIISDQLGATNDWIDILPQRRDRELKLHRVLLSYGRFLLEMSALQSKTRNATNASPQSQLFPSLRSQTSCDTISLVHQMIWLLENAQPLVENADEELLRWFMKNENILQTLFKRLQLLYQRLIYAIAFFWYFCEFPKGIRHPCTTMPWTIWPSLVVLWGVCWMFYGSPRKVLDDSERPQSGLGQEGQEEFNCKCLWECEELELTSIY